VIGRDGIAGLVCLAGSLGLLMMLRGLPQPALVPVGPAFYPRILLGITAVLSATLVVADLVSRRRSAGSVNGGRPAGSPLGYRTRYRLVLIAFAIFGAYVYLLPVAGYRVATFLFVGGLQIALEPPRGRRWLLVLAVALATMVVTYYAFERYLSVLLPRGRLTGF
jgi:putative tricarboxylic transport membrane protein